MAAVRYPGKGGALYRARREIAGPGWNWCLGWLPLCDVEVAMAPTRGGRRGGLKGHSKAADNPEVKRSHWEGRCA